MEFDWEMPMTRSVILLPEDELTLGCLCGNGNPFDEDETSQLPNNSSSLSGNPFDEDETSQLPTKSSSLSGNPFGDTKTDVSSKENDFSATSNPTREKFGVDMTRKRADIFSENDSDDDRSESEDGNTFRSLLVSSGNLNHFASKRTATSAAKNPFDDTAVEGNLSGNPFDM